MMKRKKKIIVFIIIAYFVCGFMNYLIKSVKLMSCGVKLDGVHTHLKSFENQTGRLPSTLVELGELSKTDKGAMGLTDIYCDAAADEGYMAYTYSAELLAEDTDQSIIMYDSHARHLSAATTGFWKSVLFFYCGSEKVRNVLYYDGHVEVLTESEFQKKMWGQKTAKTRQAPAILPELKEAAEIKGEE